MSNAIFPNSITDSLLFARAITGTVMRPVLRKWPERKKYEIPTHIQRDLMWKAENKRARRKARNISNAHAMGLL